MAVRAQRMRHRRFEVAMCVAVGASDCAVLAQQGETRLRMVEPFQLCYSSPARRVVTRLARASEAALVRVRMASGACGKRQADILHVRLRISHAGVALGAGHRRVSARQRKFRRGMAKRGGGLPRVCVVARRAIRAQLPAMFVRMAALALRR